MSASRSRLAFATDGSNRPYAIGGTDSSGENSVILSSVERYDPSTGLWSAVAGITQTVSGVAVAYPVSGGAAVYDGKGDIFLFGGATNSAKATTTALEYSVANNVWSTPASMTTATTEAAAVLGTDGNFYVLGGKNASGSSQATVQVYNPSTNSWTTGTSLPAADSDEAAVTDALGQIEVIGRNSSKVYVSQVIADVTPTFTTTALPAATAGVPYTATAPATGTPPPTFSLVGTVPSGLTITSSGVLSWLPTISQIGSPSVTIQASNLAGSATQTFALSVIPDTIKPTAPTLSAGAISTNSIPLSWTTVTDNDGVAGYRIYKWTPPVGHSGRGGGITHAAYYTLLVNNVTTTSYTFTGLTPFNSYNYAVTAVDTAGNESAYSNVVTGITLQAPLITYYSSTSSAVDPALSVVANHLLSFSVSAAANPATTPTIVSAPSGVVFGTYGYTWTPTADEVGVNDITVQASNSVGTTMLVIPVTVTADVPVPSLTINGGYAYGVGNMTTAGGNPFQYQLTANPGFNNDNPVGPTPQYALAGTPFTFQFSAASNTNPTTYALVSGPAAMTFDPNTGIGTWTPAASDAAATTSVTISAANSAGTSLLTFTFPTYFTTAPANVADVFYTSAPSSAPPPVITWTAPGNSAGVADYKLAVTDAPTNVTTIYDTGSTATSYTLTGVNSDQKFVTVTAYDANGNPSIASTPISFDVGGMVSLGWTFPSPSAVVGQAFSVPISPGQNYYTYSKASGPSGVSINATTGLLTWTPTLADVGTANVVVAAANGWGTVYATLAIPVSLTSVQVTSSQSASALAIAGGQQVSVAAGAALAITTDTSVTAGGVLAVDPAGAFSTGGTLTVDTGGSVTGGSVTAGAFQLNDGTVSANLSGPGGLTKGGAVTVTLSGTNTYAGGTTVSSGTLIVGGSSALPGGSSLTVGGDATSLFAPSMAASMAGPAAAPSVAACNLVAAPAVSTPASAVAHTPKAAASVDAALLQHLGPQPADAPISRRFAADFAWFAAGASSPQSGGPSQNQIHSIQALDAALAQYGA